MKTRVSRIATLLVTLMVGILIGLGRSEWTGPKVDRAIASVAATDETSNNTTVAKPKRVRRVGQVIGLRPEKKDEYIRLHAATWLTVLERIHKANIRNYSIYLTELEGKLYLFSYFDYVGNDWDADMQSIADDPETQRWWKLTDPCQNRLPSTPEGSQWLEIPEVFHTD